MIMLLGSGYIATALVREMERRGLDYFQVSRSRVDYTRFSVFYPFLQGIRPSFLINAAGFVGKPNVDQCEIEKLATYDANVFLPLSISHACCAATLPWMQLSTGCIYNGPGPYAESDPPNFCFGQQPCSHYSATKAEAERCLQNEWPCYITRLRLPFDQYDNPRNYLSKLIHYPRLYEATNSLSHRGDFVKACLDLWATGAPTGIYNITNPGAVTTHEVVAAMTEAGLFKGRAYDWFKDDEEFYKVAIAPRSSCVLNTDKLKAAGVTMRPVREALAEAVEKWVQ